MGYTKPCSYPLTFTLIYSHPLLLILNPLPLTFDSFSSTPTHLQLPSTHFKPIPDHVQTLTHFQSIPKYLHPIQPIAYHSNPYLVPVFQVPGCFAYLCANVPLFYVPMWLCNPFLWTLLPMFLYFPCLCVLTTSRLLTYTALF